MKTALAEAITCHRAGDVNQAHALCVRILEADPQYPEALHLLGVLEREQGRQEKALLYFRKALSIDPQFASAALGIGQVFYELGKSSESLPFFEQALQAEPGNPNALCSCGRALADMGHTDLALQFLRKAIEAAPEDLEYAFAAIDVLQHIEFVSEDPWYEQFLIQCLDDSRLARAPLANVALSLLWVKPAMRSALSAGELDASHLAQLGHEPLLLRLLSRVLVRSWEFERFFTTLRRTLAGALDPAHLELFTGVAEQAFSAGYVQFQSDEEAVIEQELLEKAPASLTPVEVIALASYRPLVDVPGGAGLSDSLNLPEYCQRVILRTLREPQREREIQSQIISLTPIRDVVSRRVQAQYEEHPYPRWLNIQSVGDGRQRLIDELERDALEFENPGWPSRPKVLVPGCGTGYHPLSLAGKFPEADVLAIDLSRASLAYAIRKQEELGLANVRFCQANLLDLGSLTDRFEYIDCAGVLHHLEVPMQGWRVLSGLLKPGGIMRVGLYSELARRTIVLAREKIAELGIPATSEAIRGFRQAIMSDPNLSEFRSLAKTAGDFFSMGEIRDLLFHVQEHRFDPGMIRQHLDALGLKFGGFLLQDRSVVRRFHALNPAREQWLDLDCWAEFERENPSTFYAMYQFYCYKLDSPAQPVGQHSQV